MKSLLYSLLLIALLFSCSKKQENFNADPTLILKDFNSWWGYTSQNIVLSEDFTAFDQSSKTIGRSEFLDSLASGKFVTFKLATSDSTIKYKLYKLPLNTDNSIGSQMRAIGEDEKRKMAMEGTEISDFNFIDVEGNIYNAKNTQGKIVVVKCWFIHCGACVKEIPALNEMVEKYKKRGDIVFISLAYDTKEELRKFLLTTKFEYAVIPVKVDYLENKLNISEYPTHFVVNRNGKISRFAKTCKEIESILKRELLK